MRDDSAALVPETHSVQSPLLSSIQRPAAFLRTMWLTRGGVFVITRAGEKFGPAFGGGSAPAYGPLVASTGPGAGGFSKGVNLRPRIVVPFPDSKMAT